MNFYLALFSLYSNSEATVADNWSPQGWKICFRRHLNDWEVDIAARVARMLQHLGSFKGTNANSDTIIWKHEKDAKFTVNKLYKEILKKPGC